MGEGLRLLWQKPSSFGGVGHESLSFLAQSLTKKQSALDPGSPSRQASILACAFRLLYRTHNGKAKALLRSAFSHCGR